MRVLYGVQGTGQGHISRARAMAKALEDYSIDITWFFSGRDRSNYFGMDPFKKYMTYRGLTFSTNGGKIDYYKTLKKNNIFEFLCDVKNLNLDDFELVISDFEPITAWSAIAKNKECIGIGHQYAFGRDIPTTGQNPLSKIIMKKFAPVDLPIGLRWYPYDDAILPPILDLPEISTNQGDFILVYLPFENPNEVCNWLNSSHGKSFKLYGPTLTYGTSGRVELHKTDAIKFKIDLANCGGVICNSGFELISECLQWQKPVLTKPLIGQFEQESNALALSQLKYATTISSLNLSKLNLWLDTLNNTKLEVIYGSTANELASWISKGCVGNIKELARSLWKTTGTNQRSMCHHQ